MAMAGFYIFVTILLVTPILGQNIQHRQEVLDDDGRYVLDWEINYDTKIVTFQTTVETTGYVGFGISPAGGMVGADIVIGGVDSTPYFEDRHGIAPELPPIDDEKNWNLISAMENGTHTLLAFSRDFNTCDDQDVSLTNDTTNFIWAIGSTDSIAYHGQSNRGTFQVLPLDPELPPVDVEKFKKYEITHQMVMPDQDTTYWCTIQKSPRFEQKHHIVAFEPKIVGPAAKAHTHHYAIFRCTPPEGEDAETFFEPYVGQPGGDCKVPNPGIPAQYCQTMFYTWAVGGKKLIFPDNIGCPIGESGSEVDYYMFEVHYNNPEELSGVEFETGATIYYTDELREHDAGILMVAHQTSLALMIPPKSSGYRSVGHCDPYCTSNYLPEEGINIFALLHHAHLSARKMKLRHFRGNEELPWVRNDENYDFEYQQTRPMRDEVKVLRGDHLTTECVYDTTWREGTTIGGLATRDEMCQSTFWYYPRGQLRECRSEYPMTQLLDKFGIEIANRTFMYEDALVTAPDEFVGMKYTEVLDTIIQWTPEFREEIQTDTNFEKHDAVCYIIGGSDNVPELSGFPDVKEEFIPEDECFEETSETSPPEESTTPNQPDTTESVTTTIPTTTTTIPTTTTTIPVITTTTPVTDATTNPPGESTTSEQPQTTQPPTTDPNTTPDGGNGSDKKVFNFLILLPLLCLNFFQ